VIEDLIRHLACC